MAIKNITLNFPKVGAFVYRYMQYDWQCVETIEDALNFYHKWHNNLLTTINPVKIKAIESIVYPLYSMLTNKSYQSKITI